MGMAPARAAARLRALLLAAAALASAGRLLEEDREAWGLRRGGRSRTPAARGSTLGTVRSRLPRELVSDVLDFAPFRYRAAVCASGLSVTLLGREGPRATLQGHAAEVLGLRFFPHGERALTWGRDGVVVIWDSSSGQPLGRLVDEEGQVEGAQVFPEEERVATRRANGEVVIWSINASEVLRVIPHSRRMLPRGHPWMARDVEVFPSGDRALTWGRDKWAVVWNVSSGAAVCKLEQHAFAILVASVFPGGERVITGSFDRRAIIWNASSGDVLHLLEHAHWLTGVAVLHGGELVATACMTKTTSIWRVGTGEFVHMLAHPTSQLLEMGYVLAPIPRRDLLATVDWGMVVIWNASSGEMLRQLVDHPMQRAVAAPGGDVLVACGGGRVSVWNVSSGEKLLMFEQHVDGDRSERVERSCLVAVGLASALDPHGFGDGLAWRKLP